MTIPVVGKVYTIKSKESGKYLSLVSSAGVFAEKSAVEPDWFVFYQTSKEPSHWMCWTVKSSRYSGGPLFGGIHEAHEGLPDWHAGGLDVESWEQRSADKARQAVSWEVLEESGGVRMRNLLADGYLATFQYQNAELAGFSSDKKPDATDVFVLEEVSSYAAVLAVQHVDKETPDTPALTDMNRPPEYQPQDPGLLVGVAVVPYFLVKNDHDKRWQWQAENTPYYIIKRWSRWHRVGWDTFAANKDKHYVWSTTEGVSEHHSKTISDTTRMSVTSNAGFAFEGINAGVSTSVGEDLNVTTTDEWTTNYSHTESEDTVIHPPKDEAIATWYLQDKYVFYRVDGTTDVIDFEVTVPKTKVERSFSEG